MVTFQHTVRDELGLHARPAGLLIREITRFESRVLLQNGDKQADGSKIFSIMSLCARQGHVLTVSVEGPDERDAAAALMALLAEHL